MTISIRDKAIRLAMRGMSVFPCNRDNKIPLMKGWRDAATNDPELVELWQWEDRLIGVATGPASGIAVIDIDPRHKGDEWARANAKHLQTRSHSTRSQGMHLLFRVADGSVRNSQGRIARGVDVRGDGGYFIWWPAHGCKVLDFLPLSELPEFPAWMIPEKAKKPLIRTGPIIADRYRITALLKFMRESRQGERNSRLFWAACRLAELQFADPGQRVNAVNKLLNAAMSTGLDSEEAQSTIKSAFSA